MPQAVRQSTNTSNVLCVVMGGGQGTRLFPLTRERSKPAVPLAGKYRLVDVPISNCINSGYKRVYILTQFNSASLHRHLAQAYKFDHFTAGFVEILAAEQSHSDQSWYQGTADAVRKNIVHFLNNDFDYLLILSGDQLYRMDFSYLVAQHTQTGADITIATIPVPQDQASALGIMQIDADRRIQRFVEKPKDPEKLASLRLDKEWYPRLEIEDDRELYLASMGIYVFNRRVLMPLLDNKKTDFGKHIIPDAIQSHRVFSYVYQGYWEDIGTIRSFFDANLDLVTELPRFNFFDMTAPIFSRPRYLPGSKINGAAIDHAIVADGCIINRSNISYSIVGLRSIVGEGSRLHRVVAMGSDYYETITSIEDYEGRGLPRIGIGRNCRIENAIIDKSARVGDNVVISPAGKPENVDHALYYIRDGIVIVPRGGIIPHGTVI
jgi:glucose-1-phosphate adenylyltransferase